jgi:UDP-N-acetylglucosamine--N-acetylmuramyl-(pentapeptide) pyrophosphoryl-undecaprenol N-acetylglucosamine transferase
VPAHAVAEELRRRGWSASLITDGRGLRYPAIFEDVAKHAIPSASVGGMNPVQWVRSFLKIRKGRDAARALCVRERPLAVVGYGGYPTLPAILGALRYGAATIIHEQNAVLGRVNRLLAPRVDAIATTYPQTQRLDEGYASKVALVGNPVRDAIAALRHQPYPEITENGPFRLLVIGGSQGAAVLSSVVPAAIDMLPEHFKRRLQVTQQCRPEDIDRVRAEYSRQCVAADVATYIEDMAAVLGPAHLVIARAGASTISELTAAGRPAVFVPLPIATDNHQVHNTREMVDAGGARMILQPDFTPAELAQQLQRMALEPGQLANAARRAASVGRPDAAERLADLVERLGAQVLTANRSASSQLLGVAA